MKPTSGTLSSFMQLALVVPAVAVALLAGGIGAVVNGYIAGGIGAMAPTIKDSKER